MPNVRLTHQECHDLADAFFEHARDSKLFDSDLPHALGTMRTIVKLADAADSDDDEGGK